MFTYHLSLIGLLLFSCILQQFLPAITVWHDARVLLLPLFVLCSSVTVPTAGMLLLAFLGGFLWDAQQAILVYSEETAAFKATYHSSPEEMKFGYSILLYAFMGFLMQGIQPLFREGKWHLSALLTGVAIFLYLSAEYALFSFVRGGFDLHKGVLYQILFTALLTMLLSPFVFWILFRVASLCRYTIRYDSLVKTRRTFG